MTRLSSSRKRPAHRGAEIMVIVLVKWKIEPGHEGEFLRRWREEFGIEDSRGLIGEFMCGPGSQSYITWRLADPDDPPCTIFVNVAFWADEESFRKQVEPNFSDDRDLESFEAARRVRTVLDPVSWRLGGADLPEHSSDRVL